LGVDPRFLQWSSTKANQGNGGERGDAKKGFGKAGGGNSAFKGTAARRPKKYQPPEGGNKFREKRKKKGSIGADHNPTMLSFWE